VGLVSKDDGWRIPDWLWEQMEPLLRAPPPHPLGCHRARVPDRDALDAILLVLRTGMQWNALNATGICSSSSAHRHFQEWEQASANARLGPDRASRGKRRAAAGAVPRPRLRRRHDARARRRARLHRAHPQPRRGDRPQRAQARLEGPALGRGGLPLLAQPQPGDPHPLVKEGPEDLEVIGVGVRTGNGTEIYSMGIVSPFKS